MAMKIVTVVPSDDIDNENGKISRKELNTLLEAGWEIAAEKEVNAGTEYRLQKDMAVTVQAKGPGGEVSIHKPNATQQLAAKFGVGPEEDAGGKMISAMENLAGLVGGGSHLGAVKRVAIPGVQVVSSQEIGMARDMGVHAGMRGEDPSSCPFPEGSEPWQLWMDGYKTAEKEVEERMEKPVEAYTDEKHLQYTQDEGLAYKQGAEAAQGPEDAEARCLYRGGPCYVAWVRGFTDHGGKVE